MSESVNANLPASTSADQIVQPAAPATPPRGVDIDPTTLFDTSEADAILSGVDPSVPNTTEVSENGQADTTKLTPEQIQSFKEQLGIRDTPQQVPPNQQDPTQESVQFSEDYMSANTKFKELAGMDFGAAIDAYMQAQVGMGLKDTIQTVQSMSTYINKRQGLDAVEQAQQQLRSEWGQNYDIYFQMAQEEYASLPDGQLKSSLDNADGAKLLLAKAMQTKGLPKGVARAPSISTLNRSTSPQNAVTVGQRPTLLHSEIARMSEQQYNSPEVQEALRTGNFIRDL